MQNSLEHLPEAHQHELERIKAVLLEEFDEAMRGKQALHRKAGRILKLIAHGLAPSPDQMNCDSVTILAVVNHRELADTDRHWRFALARLRQERELGKIRAVVQLDVYCLQDINRSLAAGVPYFTAVTQRGLLLYALDRTPLATPRNLPASERFWRGQDEFERWYPRAEDFLSGAGFYRDQNNLRMAAFLLHQTCEHLYQCVSWTLTLHGRRTHDLEELRAFAEEKREGLRGIWPRADRFERRCFALIRRAYVEARYEATFAVSANEIAWATERAAMLFRCVGSLCRDYLCTLRSSSVEEHYPVHLDRQASAGMGASAGLGMTIV